jgi:hypothetical protein
MPGERFAAGFGLSYRLRPSSEIHWVLQRNLRFLNDYLIKPPSVDQYTAGIAADIPQFLAEANPADLRVANRRHAMITPYLAGVDAEQGHGCGYLGLLPKWRQRGNHKHTTPRSDAGAC